jgi:hypothetical protein
MAEDSNNEVNGKNPIFLIPRDVIQLNQLLSRGLGP